MDETDQSEVLCFMASSSAYGASDGGVERHTTHISEIFLFGDRAYKIKRAVHYGFVDFSTLEARRRACEAEVRLNRRTAPEIYLGLAAICRDALGGELQLAPLEHAGTAVAIEWAVVMRRFDVNLTLDVLADQRALKAPLIDELVDAVIDLHRTAEIGSAPRGGHEGLARVIAQNAADLTAVDAPWDRVRLEALFEAHRASLEQNQDLLNARRQRGFVRRCHGDLHLGNVVLWQNRPTIFDCIEFSDDIAVIDVAYDLAFLLMDLEARGLRQLANRALGRYVGRQGYPEMLAALPLMMSLRALIRAKIAGMATHSGDAAADTARAQSAAHLFEAAEQYIAPGPRPSLVAIGGFSGTGKTTLAAALACYFGRIPGALHLRSDIIRKRLANVSPEQRLSESAYTPEANQEVYQTLLQEAGAALNAGQSVIVDAVFAQEQERQALENVAHGCGVDFFGIWLEASDGLLKRRVTQRTRDASDATPEVVSRQFKYQLGTIDWRRIEASQPFQAVLDASLSALSGYITGLPSKR